jgi:alpha-ketoglutarate-dependent taurine dioxygenase
MHVTPVDSTRQTNFAAQVNGLDLSTPLDATMLAQLWSTIDHHAVLVFRDQHLADAQLRD